MLRLAPGAGTKDLDIGGLHTATPWRTISNANFAAAPNVPSGVIVFSWMCAPRAPDIHSRGTSASQIAVHCLAQRDISSSVMSENGRWSQPVVATLYLRGKRWSVGWNGDFI